MESKTKKTKKHEQINLLARIKLNNIEKNNIESTDRL